MSQCTHTRKTRNLTARPVTSKISSPAECASFAVLGVTIDYVSAGLRHTLFRSSDGRLFGCGDQTFGQVGSGKHGEGLSIFVPELLEGSLRGKRVVKAAAGFDHSLALCDDGTLHAWGQNDYGQCDATATATVLPSPIEVGRPGGCGFPVAVVAGADTSAVVDASGGVFAWGDILHGRAFDFANATSVTVGSRVLAAMDPQGHLWTHSRAGVQRSPDSFPALRSVGVADGYTVGITADARAEIVTWGVVGRLGDGRVEDVPENADVAMVKKAIANPLFAPPVKEEQVTSRPACVPLFRGRKGRIIAVGPTHTLALVEEQQ